MDADVSKRRPAPERPTARQGARGPAAPLAGDPSDRALASHVEADLTTATAKRESHKRERERGPEARAPRGIEPAARHARIECMPAQATGAYAEDKAWASPGAEDALPLNMRLKRRTHPWPFESAEKSAPPGKRMRPEPCADVIHQA